MGADFEVRDRLRTGRPVVREGRDLAYARAFCGVCWRGVSPVFSSRSVRAGTESGRKSGEPFRGCMAHGDRPFQQAGADFEVRDRLRGENTEIVFRTGGHPSAYVSRCSGGFGGAGSSPVIGRLCALRGTVAVQKVGDGCRRALLLFEGEEEDVVSSAWGGGVVEGAVVDLDWFFRGWGPLVLAALSSSDLGAE